MKRATTRLWGSLLALALLSATAGITACKTAETVPVKSELLSRHETVAEFVGTTNHRCMGMTSLCPDECGHSGTLATFRIIRYTKYEKPGKYGDPKTERFVVMVENNLGESKLSSALRKRIAALKPGDEVDLAWDHNYVTRGGSSAPERPIRKLKRR